MSRIFISGSSTGLGLMAGELLVQRGHQVVLHARNADRAEAEAAARLFAGLRWLDSQGRAQGLRGIAAMTVPQAGLGVAINDRLGRAAAAFEAQE